jgi:required for meiotic nuclear division protein 1
MPSMTITVRAQLFGQSIEPRRITQMKILSRDPTTIALDEDAYVVLFRFGAAVFFNTIIESETAFLAQLQPYVSKSIVTPRTESLEVLVDSEAEERLDNQRFIIRDMSVARLQVVADILAKSVFLDDYEYTIAKAFDRIEPLAERMHSTGRLQGKSSELLTHIGEVLQLQHRMTGRAQVGEKPDVLWDHPEMERLWHHLENEYEIGERQLALERKLELISSTAETLLSLLQDRRTLRVEWYIVILIVIEIFLTLYDLFIRHN